MADPQAEPQIAVDPAPEQQEVPEVRAYPEPRANPRAAFAHGQRKPAGPQLWAVVLSIAGIYYVWTRILGKPLPSFGRGHRIAKAKLGGGSSRNRQAEIAAARERQQQRLENAARAKEMVAQANKDKGNIRERTNVSSGNKSALTIEEQARLLRQQQQEKQKRDELEAQKKKQRQLYLKKEAEKEAEEEARRKDEELGPGWRYREDPNAAANAVNNMNPQSGGGGGGYKPQSCSRKGG